MNSDFGDSNMDVLLHEDLDQVSVEGYGYNAMLLLARYNVGLDHVASGFVGSTIEGGYDTRLNYKVGQFRWSEGLFNGGTAKGYPSDKTAKGYPSDKTAKGYAPYEGLWFFYEDDDGNDSLWLFPTQLLALDKRDERLRRAIDEVGA